MIVACHIFMQKCVCSLRHLSQFAISKLARDYSEEETGEPSPAMIFQITLYFSTCTHGKMSKNLNAKSYVYRRK